jgi:ribose 5-phosphate isomerase B
MTKQRRRISIIIGSDHAGFQLKEEIKSFFDRKKLKYKDIGTYSEEPVDYPDIVKLAVKEMRRSKLRKGILICGTGIGMCIAANRYKKIRAAVVYDAYSAKMSREDDDANVLCLRARNFSHLRTLKIIEIWLRSRFSGVERHLRRIEKLDKK